MPPPGPSPGPTSETALSGGCSSYETGGCVLDSIFLSVLQRHSTKMFLQLCSRHTPSMHFSISNTPRVLHMEARVVLLRHWSYLVLSCFRLRGNPTVSSNTFTVSHLSSFPGLSWHDLLSPPPLGLHLPPFVSYLAAPLMFQIQDCSRLIASTQHPTASSRSRAQRLCLTVWTKAPLPTPLVFHCFIS